MRAGEIAAGQRARRTPRPARHHSSSPPRRTNTAVPPFQAHGASGRQPHPQGSQNWLVQGLRGLVLGVGVRHVGDVASREELHARHRGWCGGDGGAARAPGRSCARRARSAFTTFSRARCVCQQARGLDLACSSRSMDEPLAISRSAYALARLLTRDPCRWDGRGCHGRPVGSCPFSRKIATRFAHANSYVDAPTLPRALFGRISIFFNVFYSVEKRVTRSRELR